MLGFFIAIKHIYLPKSLLSCKYIAVFKVMKISLNAKKRDRSYLKIMKMTLIA